MSSTSVIARIAQQITRRPLLQTLSTTRPATRQHINSVFSSRSYATEDTVADVEIVVKKPRKPRAKSTEPKTPLARASKTPKAPKAPKTPKAAKAPVVKKPKRELTDDEKMKKKVAELKKVAMLDQPAGLPVSGWTVFVTETKGTVSTIKSTAEAFSQLSDARKEHFANIAQANTVANREALKAWVEAHTPIEITTANRARSQLRKIAKLPVPEGRQKGYVNAHGRSYYPIPDKRATRPATAFAAFVREQHQLGLYKGVKGPEALSQISEDYKKLSENEKAALKSRAAEGLGTVTADV